MVRASKMVSQFLIAGLVLFITGKFFSCLYSFNWLTHVSITEYSRDKTPKSPVMWSTYQSIKSLIFSYKHSLYLPMKSKVRFAAQKKKFSKWTTDHTVNKSRPEKVMFYRAKPELAKHTYNNLRSWFFSDKVIISREYSLQQFMKTIKAE